MMRRFETLLIAIDGRTCLKELRSYAIVTLMILSNVSFIIHTGKTHTDR